MAKPVIELDHVSKQYPNGFLALDKVSLAFHAGEIHALLGENGAGKSTVMNTLYGVHQPTQGGVLMDGRQVVHRRPADAIANGIGMVHQHFKLVMPFSVAENLALVAKGERRAAFANHAQVRRFMQGFGVELDPNARVADLPLALQQRVEILKALVNDSRVLLLDEPSTILTPAEIEGLYDVLRTIRDRGTAVAVVTHNIDEVLANADRYTVLRRGRTNGTGLTADCNAAQLVERIVGTMVVTGSRFAPPRTGAERLLSLTHASVAARHGSPGLQDIHLHLHRAQVIGVAGVEGNGQTELFEVLAGQLPLQHGERQCAAEVRVALVPQDRHHEGLSLDLPVSHNLLYPEIMQGAYRRWGLLDHQAIAERAKVMIEQSDIRTQSHATPARALSGGNQQKIVLARALAAKACIIVVYQPTRGLDVAAAEAVLTRLAEAANQGTCVVVISSNIEELIRISDRVLVMNAGRITGELHGEDISLAQIGPLMTLGRQTLSTAVESSHA